jgi:hypothetical protein
MATQHVNNGLLCLIAAISLISSSAFALSDGAIPRLFPLDAQNLALTKTEYLAKQERITAQVDALLDEAKMVKEAGVLYSVTFNDFLPPSGDKHDFFSLSPYWWPNPDSPDGLPYFRKDGEVNPERDKVSDRGPCEQMLSDSKLVTLAYYYSNDESYGLFASQLIRTWFLDPKTRMNPNMTYGQAIPGVKDSNGLEIIGTRKFVQLLDCFAILGQAGLLTPAEIVALDQWFADYTQWLETSSIAAKERARKNNHGTSYDMQLIAYYIHAKEFEKARTLINTRVKDRIDHQVDPDGKQPEELVRTKGWNYCIENLKYLFCIALLAEKVDIDLFNYEAPRGGSLKKAMDYLTPYATIENTWPHDQITDWQGDRLAALLYIASLRYDDPSYIEKLKGLNEYPADLLIRITSPSK